MTHNKLIATVLSILVPLLVESCSSLYEEKYDIDYPLHNTDIDYFEFIKFKTEKEGVGVGINRRDYHVNGHFKKNVLAYKTTDGGKTWELTDTLSFLSDDKNMDLSLNGAYADDERMVLEFKYFKEQQQDVPNLEIHSFSFSDNRFHKKKEAKSKRAVLIGFGRNNVYTTNETITNDRSDIDSCVVYALNKEMTDTLYSFKMKDIVCEIQTYNDTLLLFKTVQGNTSNDEERYYTMNYGIINEIKNTDIFPAHMVTDYKYNRIIIKPSFSRNIFQLKNSGFSLLGRVPYLSHQLLSSEGGLPYFPNHFITNGDYTILESLRSYSSVLIIINKNGGIQVHFMKRISYGSMTIIENLLYSSNYLNISIKYL